MEVETILYHGAWLAAALAGIALLSAAITRHKRRPDVRHGQAVDLLETLQTYSDWISSQRLAALYHREADEARAALDRACALRQAYFPELVGEMAGLLSAHGQLLAFMQEQQELWMHDPQAWLASDHDARFMGFWRQHRAALRALQGALQPLSQQRRRDPARNPIVNHRRTA